MNHSVSITNYFKKKKYLEIDKGEEKDDSGYKISYNIDMRIKCRLFIIIAVAVIMTVCGGVRPSILRAAEVSKLGVHLLSPGDLDYAVRLLKLPDNSDKWHYVTIPLAVKDLSDLKLWQDFFRRCQEMKLIPIVRLATTVENGSWQRPTRFQIVRSFDFLNQLPWPTDERLVIAYNEVNHAKEWGGAVDPLSYTHVLEFVLNWAHTEQANYKILPAAMDLAAPNSTQTREAFSYLSEMLQINPWIFDHIDFWNSHSYPNPGFSASPTNSGQNSLRGFQHELNFIKNRVNRDLEVFITETGWVDNRVTRPWLSQYYLYAVQHVWSDERVKGVTPFLIRGAPGPFAQFSFFDDQDLPTPIFKAVQETILETD
ncbi:MAG TPA: hypothetical protein PLM16_02230 [Candidatus Woesebacteria bacterium]|nr:hypothetical protein [Candidatus Woesebacteria bacterium]